MRMQLVLLLIFCKLPRGFTRYPTQTKALMAEIYKAFKAGGTDRLVTMIIKQ